MASNLQQRKIKQTVRAILKVGLTLATFEVHFQHLTFYNKISAGLIFL